jgi:hypothetical protein
MKELFLFFIAWGIGIAAIVLCGIATHLESISESLSLLAAAM